jgi:hypothetical protein
MTSNFFVTTSEDKNWYSTNSTTARGAKQSASLLFTEKEGVTLIVGDKINGVIRVASKKNFKGIWIDN